MRIKPVLISLFFMSQLAFAGGDWTIKSGINGYTINNAKFSDTELEMEGPSTPKIIENTKRSSFDIVVVDHGEVGTSCMVRIQKAYVFDTKKKKFLGTFPYRVIAVDNKVKKCKVKPIKWEFFKNFIMVHDKNNNKKYKISANSKK